MYVRMNCENNILITHFSGRQAGVFTFEPLLYKNQRRRSAACTANQRICFHFMFNILFLYSLIPKIITKTCQCNAYPLEPHFCIAKTGVCRGIPIFLFLFQNIDCGYSLEPPRRGGSSRGGSNVYPQFLF